MYNIRIVYRKNFTRYCFNDNFENTMCAKIIQPSKNKNNTSNIDDANTDLKIF